MFRGTVGACGGSYCLDAFKGPHLGNHPNHPNKCTYHVGQVFIQSLMAPPPEDLTIVYCENHSQPFISWL